MFALFKGRNDDRQESFVAMLYKKYEKKIYVYAMSLLQNNADAEDCVHNVLVRVMERIDEFQTMAEVNVKQYLMIYCRSEAAKIRYRKRKDQDHLLSMSKSDEVFHDGIQYDIPDSTADNLRLAINDENVSLIRNLIQELKPIYRDVIVMRYYYNRSSTQIAEELGISENLVNQRLHRAREILKEKGGNELYEAYRFYN